MIRMIISVFFLLFCGCAVSGVKVSVHHTNWNDGRDPTTVSVETDFKFNGMPQKITSSCVGIQNGN